MGEYDEVIRDLDAAIELDPGSPWTLISRSLAHSWKGEIDAAIRDLDTAIRLDPDSATAYNARGSHYMDAGEYEKALQDFDKAIEPQSQLPMGVRQSWECPPCHGRL